MMRWKSMGPRVATQILQPKRLLMPDHHTQDAFPHREGPDPGLGLLIDADGDELTQAPTIFVEHSDRAIFGPKDLARHLGNLLEDRF
jgi:hypothetical protein